MLISLVQSILTMLILEWNLKVDILMYYLGMKMLFLYMQLLLNLLLLFQYHIQNLKLLILKNLIKFN